MRREVLLIGEMVDAVEQILQLSDRVTEGKPCFGLGLVSRSARGPAAQRC
jgi:hypothetical protein